MFSPWLLTDSWLCVHVTNWSSSKPSAGGRKRGLWAPEFTRDLGLFHTPANTLNLNSGHLRPASAGRGGQAPVTQHRAGPLSPQWAGFSAASGRPSPVTHLLPNRPAFGTALLSDPHLGFRRTCCSSFGKHAPGSPGPEHAPAGGGGLPSPPSSGGSAPLGSPALSVRLRMALSLCVYMCLLFF